MEVEEIKHILVQKLKFTHLDIEKLNELDTQNVEPTAHVLGLKNIFRDDMVMEPLTDHDPINDSPAHSKGHYEVPKII